MSEDTGREGRLLTIVPSCDTYEAHFGKLDVDPVQLANGSYRGTWISQYAAILQRFGIRVRLVVPTLGENVTYEGSLLTLVLVRASLWYRLAARLGGRLNRSRARVVFSALSSLCLRDQLIQQKSDCVYLQEYATGRYLYLSRVLTQAGVAHVGAYHGTSVAQLGPWQRAFSRGVHRLSVLTTEEMNCVLESQIEADVSLIPNAVNSLWFEARSTRSQDGCASIVWVGRMERRAKGLALLLSIVERFSPEDGYRFIVVGDGPDRHWFESCVISAGLGELVSIIGRIDSADDLAEVLAASVVVLNTSSVEGFPISVLEAMSAGCGVVATNLPYVATELRGAPAVASYSSGDAGAAARLIVEMSRMMLDEDVRAAQRSWVRARFSEDVFAAQIIEFAGLPYIDT